MAIALENIFKGQLRDAACLPGYVRAICANIARRPDSSSQTVELDLDRISARSLSAEQNLLAEERANLVRNVLRTLAIRDRNILVDLFYNDLKREEVCAKYGVTRTNLGCCSLEREADFRRSGRRETKTIGTLQPAVAACEAAAGRTWQTRVLRNSKLHFAALYLMLSALPAVAADFLWLSDIHFDPLADRAIVDKLAAIEPAQWAEVLASGAAKFPPYGRDTNWPLFSSLLQATAKQKPKVAFSLVTGDLLVHHFREQFNAAATVHDDQSFRSFVRKSFEFVALELKRRYPGKPVFLTLGNNDDECGDYALQPGGPFLEDTAKAVGDLAGLANIDSYVQLGSYSVPNPAVKHERIVVLNTYFSPRYSDRCGGQGTVDAGEKLLAWLATQLKSAKSRHEKVWLAYHIPPGVDAFATTHAKQPGTVTLLWKDSYVQRFLSLVQQYEGVVGPNFAGHIHVDDFRLLEGSRKDLLLS